MIIIIIIIIILLLQRNSGYEDCRHSELAGYVNKCLISILQQFIFVPSMNLDLHDSGQLQSQLPWKPITLKTRIKSCIIIEDCLLCEDFAFHKRGLDNNLEVTLSFYSHAPSRTGFLLSLYLTLKVFRYRYIHTYFVSSFIRCHQQLETFFLPQI